MHGPDGTDYQEWISWTEIAPPERIALLHGERRGDPNAFESVITFTPDGAATRIEMRTVFPTREMRDEVVEKYHAIEGGQQTLANPHARIRGFPVPYPTLVWLHHHGELPPEGTMAAYFDETCPINRIENLKLAPCEPLPVSWGRSARPVHSSVQ
jgi:hypothetical protein